MELSLISSSLFGYSSSQRRCIWSKINEFEKKAYICNLNQADSLLRHFQGYLNTEENYGHGTSDQNPLEMAILLIGVMYAKSIDDGPYFTRRYERKKRFVRLFVRGKIVQI